jgi:pyruvate-formate lyase-activating enzyme
MQRIGLHLTDRCQLDCDHCLRDPGRAPLDLDVDVVAAVLRDASELYGIRRVSLTGGEPTLHPRFGEVLDLVAARSMTWDMVTNGRRMSALLEIFADRPSRRGACAQVVFSLDGATDATHDAIRSPGQRREVLGAIALAAVEGVPFGVQMAVHAKNVDEIEALGLEAAQLGARHVSFAMMQPTGTRLDEGMRLSAAGWRDALERIRRLAAVLRIPVIAPEGWPKADRMRLCDALRGDTLHVDVRGRLSLCCLQSGIPGESDREVAGDARGGLVAPHRRLLAIVRDATEARLDALQSSDEWAEFECNSCLARFGKPHWTEAGVGGPAARRERWHGAWSRSVDTDGATRVSLAVRSDADRD